MELSCFVKVTLTLSTFVWFVGVIKTSPLSFGVTVGAVGFTLTVTSIVLDGLACVATGCASLPDCDTGNVTFTL